MGHRTKEECREALATISSLKRVLGIANHPTQKDTLGAEDGRLRIYTPDEESATLLGELLYRYGTGNQAAHYRARPEQPTIRDTIRTEAVNEGGYLTTMWVPWPLSMKTALNKMIKKHTAPDSRFIR